MQPGFVFVALALTVLVTTINAKTCLLPVTLNPSNFTTLDGTQDTISVNVEGQLGLELIGVQECPRTEQQFQQFLSLPEVSVQFSDMKHMFTLRQESAVDNLNSSYQLQDLQISIKSGRWQGEAFSYSFIAANSSIVLQDGMDAAQVTNQPDVALNSSDISGSFEFDNNAIILSVPALVVDLSFVDKEAGVSMLLIKGPLVGEVILEEAEEFEKVVELKQFCRVPATVQTSSFQVEGNANIGGEIVRRPEEVGTPIEFQGTIFVLFEGQCADTITQETRTKFVGQEQGLIVSPQDIGLQLGQLADVNLLGLQVFFESSPFSGVQTFDVITDVVLPGGAAKVKGTNVFTSGVDLTQSMVGATTSARLRGRFEGVDQPNVLTADSFASNFTIEEELGSTGITIVATINLRGEFVADLDWSNTAEVNLVTDENVDVEVSPKEPKEEVIETQTVSVGSEMLLQTVEASPEGTCPARFQLTDIPGTCSCASGWGGLRCSQCQSKQACIDWLLPDPKDDRRDKASCSNDQLYISTSQMKSYSCEVDGEAQDIVAPGSLNFVCQTHGFPYRLDASAGFGNRLQTVGTDSQQDDSGEEKEAVANCQIAFAVKGSPPTPISCVTTDCTFVVDTPNVECKRTECKCVGECSETIRNVTQQVKNGVKLIKREGARFEVKLADISFIKLFGECKAGECRMPGLAEVVGNGTIITDEPYDKEHLVMVSSMPIVFLLFICLVSALYLMFNWSYWKRVSFAGPVAETIERSLSLKENYDLHGSSSEAPQEKHIAVYPRENSSEAPQEKHIAVYPQPLRHEQLLLLQFSGINCQVNKKILLHDIHGVAMSGEVVGVMGPSGSGKTTLLSILSFQNQDLSSSSVVGGSIQLGGESRSNVLRKVIGFVPQFENLLPTLTVEETVRYAALVRLPLNVTPDQINDRIRTIFDDLGLWGVVSSRVGGHGIRGVSGGEKKRVSIAMEMVTDPPCLIMDEPTSGLDSFTASKLLDTCKAIASRGRIIMLSLHQPSPDMFMKLDKVMLLAQGYKIYVGPPGDASSFFGRMGFERTQQDMPIAEHMLSVVQVPSNLCTVLSKLKPFEMSSQTLVALGKAQPLQQFNKSDESRACYGAKFYRRLSVLFWRTAVEIIRNPTLLVLHWSMAILMGTLVGMVFLDVADDISGAQNRAGVAFFSLCLFAFSSLTSIDLLMSERQLVIREVRSRYYSMIPYFFGKLALDGILLRAIPVLLYTSIVYRLMGLQTDSVRVAFWCMFLILFACTIGVLAMAVAAVVRTPGQASLLMNLILLINVLVAGYLVNTDSMPNYVVWVHYASVFSYGFEALIVNEVLGLNLKFTVESIGTAVVDGKLFLNTLSLNPDDQDLDVYLTLVFYVGFAVLALSLMMLATCWKSFLNYVRGRKLV